MAGGVFQYWGSEWMASADFVVRLADICTGMPFVREKFITFAK